MQKPSSEHIRIMCYNVNWDSIFENGDPDNHPWRAYDMSDEFVRVVTAINPGYRVPSRRSTLTATRRTWRTFSTRPCRWVEARRGEPIAAPTT